MTAFTDDDRDFLRKFINCSVFSPPVEDVAKAQEALTRLLDEHASLAMTLRAALALAPLPVAEERWAWMEPQSESAHGPFASGRLAIEDASRALGAADLLVCVGRCEPFEPHRWVNAIGGNIDDVIERMEILAADNGWGFDDQFIDADDDAEKALEELLTTWAKRHLTSTRWRVQDEEPPFARTVDPATLPPRQMRCPACGGRHVVGDDLPEACGGGPCPRCNGRGTVDEASS